MSRHARVSHLLMSSGHSVQHHLQFAIRGRIAVICHMLRKHRLWIIECCRRSNTGAAWNVHP